MSRRSQLTAGRGSRWPAQGQNNAAWYNNDAQLRQLAALEQQIRAAQKAGYIITATRRVGWKVDSDEW